MGSYAKNTLVFDNSFFRLIYTTPHVFFPKNKNDAPDGEPTNADE